MKKKLAATDYFSGLKIVLKYLAKDKKKAQRLNFLTLVIAILTPTLPYIMGHFFDALGSLETITWLGFFF